MSALILASMSDSSMLPLRVLPSSTASETTETDPMEYVAYSPLIPPMAIEMSSVSMLPTENLPSSFTSETLDLMDPPSPDVRVNCADFSEALMVATIPSDFETDALKVAERDPMTASIPLLSSSTALAESLDIEIFPSILLFPARMSLISIVAVADILISVASRVMPWSLISPV